MSSVMDNSNRTIIGSVVFVDIVGYSKKSVSEQILMKERFTGLLSDSLKDIANDQRIILDTGDGVALSFLGDPEDALFVGMNLRDLLRKASPGAPEPSEDATSTRSDLFLRIGINLGPIKLIRDINGQPNIVGDGINVAQRIMSFARPGQVVVSRSFYDVVSVVSEEYAQLFKYEGSRTDKHVREHEIYIVGDSAAAFDKAKSGMEDRAASTNPRSAPAAGGPADKAARAAQAKVAAEKKQNAAGTDDGAVVVPLMQDRKKLTMVGGILGVVVLVLTVMVATKKPGEPLPVKSEIVATAPASKAEPPKQEPSKTEPVAAAGAAGVPQVAAPVVTTGLAATGTAPSPASPPTMAAVTLPAAKSDEKKADDKKPAAKADPVKAEPQKADPAKVVLVPGTVNLAIQPWGEVFVNGKSIGTSPPIKQHKLAPGKYKIEVRNTTFTPLVTNVEIKAREDINIRHQFK